MADNKTQKTTKPIEKNKYSNAVNRTTSESLRLGESEKPISHPTSLTSTTGNAKKKTSFQITSVTVGSRMSNDGGDDSADDLDESHTEDISDVIDVSRVTDIENETPSYSEDTFSKDDVFFNSSASLGSAPVIPTSSQYGLAIVAANENCGNSSATCTNNIAGSELHVSVPDNVINLVGVKHNETEMRDIHSHPGRNERFKVVKIESTEPFKRGRWMCMDYLDHTMVQSQQSQSNVSNQTSKETNDTLQNTTSHQATDSGICMSEMPQQLNSVEDKVPSNTDKGTQQDLQPVVQYANQNTGQTTTGAYSNLSPGQTMQLQSAGMNNCQAQMLQQHVQSMSLSTPMPQNVLNSNQHQSLQAQQMQQVIASANMPMQQVQMPQQVPPQQIQPQPVQMQHLQQFQQQPQPPPQQVNMQPMQQMHSIQPQPMQVSQPMMQQMPAQSMPAQPNYSSATAHVPQPIHTMPVQTQPTPQSYPAAGMQQCPPGLSPQQMMSVQHPMQPQPQYYATPQGITMMPAPNQQQPPQMMTMPTQVPHQPNVNMQQTFSVPSLPQHQQQQQQQQPPPQQQQQQQPPPPQSQQQQQQPQQQLPIGHSASMHHVPAASVATSIAGYAPVGSGQSSVQVPAPVSQSNPIPSSQPAAVQMIQQMYGTVMQGQIYGNGSVPSSVVEAMTSEAGMIEQVVQSAALLESLANVTAVVDEIPVTGEDPESASGTNAVAIDNKIEQAMDLVKSHLMFAVREEVEVLKEKIAELMDRINHLEVENTILKANASQETLAQLTNLPQPPSSGNAP